MATGTDTPTVGRISTLPSIRGYNHRHVSTLPLPRSPRTATFDHVVTQLTKVADMPGYPTRKALFGGPQTRTKAVIAADRST